MRHDTRDDATLAGATVLVLAGTVAVIAARSPINRHDLADLLTVLAAVIELAGLVLIVLDLSEARRRARHYEAAPELLHLMAKERGFVVESTAGELADAATGHPLPRPPLEERVEHLEQNIDRRIRAAGDALHDELFADIGRALAAADASAKRREEKVVALIGVLGARWRPWIGVLLVFLGIVLGAAANIVST